MILLSKKSRLLLSIEQWREIGQDEARKNCLLLLLLLGYDTVGPGTQINGVHCCEDPVSTTAITIFGGAMGLPFTKPIRILLYLTQFCIRLQVCYPPPPACMAPCAPSCVGCYLVGFVGLFC